MIVSVEWYDRDGKTRTSKMCTKHDPSEIEAFTEEFKKHLDRRDKKTFRINFNKTVVLS